MGLRDENKVDLMAIEKETGKVNLIIIDTEDWQDEEEHIILLQEKINTYLSFIETGEIYAAYPEVKDRELVIKVHAKYPCTEWGKKFLERADEILVNAGFDFKYSLRPLKEWEKVD